MGDITGWFKVSCPAISHHLKHLKDAGILPSEKSGQEVFYHLDRPRLANGLRFIADSIEECCSINSD